MICNYFSTNHQAVQAKTATIVSALNPEQPIDVKRHLKVDTDLKSQTKKIKIKNLTLINKNIQNVNKTETSLNVMVVVAFVGIKQLFKIYLTNF